jgi:hypothetical protein
MRRTMGETKEALEFLVKIDQLSQDQREHMRVVFSMLIDCCLSKDIRGVVVVSKDDEPNAVVMSVNSSDMETSILLSKVDEAFMLKHLQDQPSKEQLN